MVAGKSAALLTFLVSAFALTTVAAATDCLCATIYDPVCGEGNKTFSSACEADCAGVAVVRTGECESSDHHANCACPKNLDPMCGTDGKTYNNPCLADCAKVDIAYEGNCANEAGCAAVSCISSYEPVCGANNVTYSNDCQASCTGVRIVYQGECGSANAQTNESGLGGAQDPTTCVCPENLDPMCGMDGKTYNNPCLAECAKARVAYGGNCANPDGCKAVRCVTQYDPVCGANGKQYQNECFAACTGVSFKQGPCKGRGARPPPRKLSPPAGRRSPPKKAASPPRPLSRKVDAAQCKQCEQDPQKPVCGADWITYGNVCLANCSGVTVVGDGECP